MDGRAANARYCSRECNDDAQNDKKRARVIAARQDRACAWCGGPIAPEVTGRARFCKPECRTRWFNRRASQAKSERYRMARETRPPCANPACGVPIPAELRGGTKYCSPECKRVVNDASWRARSPHYNREYNYGVTQEQWESKLTEQGHRCVVCRCDDWPGPGRNNNGRPHTEHDHKTKKFRGASCGKCNLMLGHADDDPLRLIAAARYLLTAEASPDGLGQHCDDLDLLGDALLALAGDDPALLRAADSYLEAAHDRSGAG